MPDIRVRIAPSPTGNLHIGTARTALFNYLFAKHNNGKFVLRIEDTDLLRSDKKYEKDIFDGLNWLGIEADESPEKGGSYGPYRQSERIDIYKNYIEKLLREGKVFYCFHTEEELENEKQKLIEEKKPQLHFCEFRTMDMAEADSLKDIKKNYIIRFKTPAGKTIKFKDLIRGEVSFESDLLGDFSIAKDVSIPLYNFAVVIDDEEMKISHVIRGEDHISNTPKQMLIAESLGFSLPQYAHLPLILNLDKSKMSKRNPMSNLEDFKEDYLPEALFNFVALLGWHPENDREILTKKELIKEFSLERIQKSGAIFDIQKLDWMNGEYIRSLSLEELLRVVEQDLPPEHKNFPQKYILKVLALEQPRLKRLPEIGEKVDYFFRKPEYDKELLHWKSMTDEEVIKSLEATSPTLEEVSAGKFIAEELKEKIYSDKKGILNNQRIREAIAVKIHKDGVMDFDFGRILWPLRVALSGKKASPGPFEIMEVLGKEESLKRIELAKSKLV